jgi:hypothetical protein
MKRLWNLPAFLIGTALAGGVMINVGAIAQGFIGIFQNGTALAPSVYGEGDPTSGLYFGTGFTGTTRHIASGSTATNNIPVLSNGGASPVLKAGSTDTAGQFSSTSGTTTLTATFGTAWTTAPACIVQEQGGTVAPTYTVSTTAITITVMVAATNYNYLCVGLSGG